MVVTVERTALGLGIHVKTPVIKNDEYFNEGLCGVNTNGNWKDDLNGKSGTAFAEDYRYMLFSRRRRGD